MNQKIIGFLILVLSIFGLATLFKDELLSDKGGKIQVISNGKSQFVAPLDLNIRWRKDFEGLVEKGEIPKAWASIREVRFIPLDKPLIKLVEKLSPPLSTKSDGGYILEITLMSHVGDDGHTYIIFQHNILDVEHENTLWELNRSYPLIASAGATKGSNGTDNQGD